MPIGPAHTAKRSKNLVALMILVLLASGFYYLTVLKITQRSGGINTVASKPSGA